MTTPPAPGTYAPFYAGYVDLVGDADVLAVLETQEQELRRFITEQYGESRGDYRYQPGKWTVRQLLQHLNDAERIMAYRALRIARHDTTDLPGFEENDYARVADGQQRTTGDLLDEFAAIRLSTLHLLRHLPAADWDRGGTANNAYVTVRALAYIMAGHVIHHMNILRERYV